MTVARAPKRAGTPAAPEPARAPAPVAVPKPTGCYECGETFTADEPGWLVFPFWRTALCPDCADTYRERRAEARAHELYAEGRRAASRAVARVGSVFYFAGLAVALVAFVVSLVLTPPRSRP